MSNSQIYPSSSYPGFGDLLTTPGSPATTVTGLQTYPVANFAPQAGEILYFSQGEWQPTLFSGVQGPQGSQGPFSTLFDTAGDSVVLGQGGNQFAISNAAGSASVSNSSGNAYVTIKTGLTILGATPTAPASQLGVGATTATTATSGSETLPAQPAGFLVMNLGGTVIKIPYYNA
jgi:hypothetical protein